MLFSSMILMTMVSGTDNSAPRVPQISYQTTRDNSTTTVESPSLRPIHIGSIMLPMTMFATM